MSSQFSHVFPEDVLAYFSQGTKNARLGAMAQEIARLANENAELRQGSMVVSEATVEAQHIVAKAKADAFSAARKAWEEGSEARAKCVAEGTFIPAPLRTAAVELQESLSHIGHFDPEKKYILLNGGDEYPIAGSKKDYIDNYVEFTGVPANGDEAEASVVVDLVGNYAASGDNEDYTTSLGVEVGGKMLGYISSSYARDVKKFILAASALGISVFAEAELYVTASQKTGSLRNKAVVHVPDKFLTRDAAPKIHRAIKVMNSIYASASR
ncbi:hypothetical protein [Rothia terrae]|uniref:Uncharacterized protein n=1 Tax=Rothia terrae TaxID=396015 RepID=A0A7H2BGG0_9MICC|nr:hypothetical protein [Rothia terrae]QNV38756.1 hypothetical protein IDM49_05815 [Rothia terrae]